MVESFLRTGSLSATRCTGLTPATAIVSLRSVPSIAQLAVAMIFHCSPDPIDDVVPQEFVDAEVESVAKRSIPSKIYPAIHAVV